MQTLKEISASCIPFMEKHRSEFTYRSFEDFLQHTPYKLWRNFCFDKYYWAPEDRLFLIYKRSDGQKDEALYVSFPVRGDQHQKIREWIRDNMPLIWRVL